MFSLEQGKKLVSLARHSIETYFSKESIELDEYKEFSEKQGVFVSLKKENNLRGCIGFPEPTHPLYRAVFEAARSAAFQDPRFPPLSKDELEETEIEVSVLTVPDLIEVKDPKECVEQIEIGKDGLIIKCFIGSGLLLPQVPVEWKWSREEFLNHLCIKAGTNPGEWKNPDNKIYKFQAQIFAEYEGEVVEKEM